MAEHKPGKNYSTEARKKLQHRSQEKMTAQKPGKNGCTEARKKRVSLDIHESYFQYHFQFLPKKKSL